MKKRSRVPAIIISVLSILIIFTLVSGSLLYLDLHNPDQGDLEGDQRWWTTDYEKDPGVRFEGKMMDGILYDVDGSNQDTYTEFTQDPIVQIDVVLTWTDEGSYPGYRNEPDSFSLFVDIGRASKVNTGENSLYETGKLMINFVFGEINAVVLGEIQITVSVNDCGDHVPTGGPYWMEIEDDSNAYGLDLSYSHLA